MRARGFTDVHEVLSVIFNLAESRWIGANHPGDAGPDTIMLLGDGAPTAGTYQDVELLLGYVEERNRHLGLRFHCVALRADDPLLPEGLGLWFQAWIQDPDTYKGFTATNGITATIPGAD